MADERQSKQEKSDNPREPMRGGGQAVVSLCKVSESGLVFWSRHRFDLAAELQVRVRTDVLPRHLRLGLKSDEAGWATVRGFVVECRAIRRPGGAAVFRVSLVLDAALLAPARLTGAHPPLFRGGRTGRLFGLN
ncbi:MAG: hypothetical protein K1X78_27190 [Verrucomicrobiaceae bacterium]|nr:hypothetical protein [Verrucomicrobiaceae bacterium]